MSPPGNRVKLQLRGGVWWARVMRSRGWRDYCLGTSSLTGAWRVLTWEGEMGFMACLEDALVTDYRAQERPAKTLRRAQLILGSLRAFCSHLDIAADIRELTTEMLTRWVQHRLQNHRPGMVHMELCVIRRGLQILCDWGRIPRVPRIPKVRQSPPRQGFLSDGALKEICGRISGQEVVPLLWFLCYTGWRVSEAKNLSWGAVDFCLGVVRLEPGKTKNREGREFPFRYLQPLGTLLRNQRNAITRMEHDLGCIVPWVFARPTGSRIADFHSAWTTACRRAGYPGACVHDLRRSAVRRLELAGIPRAVGMRLTGHRTERVYHAYAIVRPEDLEDGIRKLDGFLRKSPKKA